MLLKFISAYKLGDMFNSNPDVILRANATEKILTVFVNIVKEAAVSVILENVNLGTLSAS